MIRELRVSGLKAFDKFRLTFGDHAILVGPNNAGKSTLISALRSVSVMLRIAKQLSPDQLREHDGLDKLAYGLSGERVGLVEENLRHEFRPDEARIYVRFSNGNTLTAVWPSPATISEDADEDATSPFFYLDVKDQAQPRRPSEVRKAFPIVGVVPIPSPVERSEPILNESYVREQTEGRLASRHFRNHLLLLDNQARLQDFLDFAQPWMPDIALEGLETRLVPAQGLHIDFFLREQGSRTEREICWAGDGIQVWLQLLFHLFRLHDATTIVLDEPDLYLHPDLQRRLIRLMDSVKGQTIMATHSSEILAEAAPDHILWVDKFRKAAIRSPMDDSLARLSGAIGSQFNLRLAKALRSRVVLFVEGNDLKLVSILARTLGAVKVANEQGIAVVPIKGFSNWEHIEPFVWLVDHFLSHALKTFVILDRDYRSHTAVQNVTKRLSDIGIVCRVWDRKELESYLLSPAALSRITKLTGDEVHELLLGAAEELKVSVFARVLDEAMREKVGPRSHRVTVTEQVQREFDEQWMEPEKRLALVPPKDVLHIINRNLQMRKLPTVSFRMLAKSMRALDIAPQVLSILQQVEESA